MEVIRLTLGVPHTVWSKDDEGITLRVTARTFSDAETVFAGMRNSEVANPGPYYNQVILGLPLGNAIIGPWVSYVVTSPDGRRRHFTDRPVRGNVSVFHLPCGYRCDVSLPNWTGANGAIAPSNAAFGLAQNPGTLVISRGHGNEPNQLRFMSDWVGPLANGGTMPANATQVYGYSNNVLGQVPGIPFADFGRVRELYLTFEAANLPMPGTAMVMQIAQRDDVYGGTDIPTPLQGTPIAGLPISFAAVGHHQRIQLFGSGDYRDSIATGGRNISTIRQGCFDGNPSLHVLCTALSNALDLIFLQMQGIHEVTL